MDEIEAQGDAHERVVVTGLGVVCPHAADVDAFWGLLHAPPRAAQPTAAPRGQSATLQRLPAAKAQYLDDTSSYAIAAAEQALLAAGLFEPGAEAVAAGDEMGLCLGTLSGPIKWGLTHGYADAVTDLLNPPVPARAAVVAYYGSAIGNITITFRIAGPALVFCNLDVAGTDAIGYAYESIRHGKARVMLAGGADSPLNPLVMGELGRSGLLPESGAGDGPLLAEGAALLVLESLSSARERGAEIHAEVVGYATGTAGIEPAGRGAIDWGGVDCVVTTGPLQPSAEDRERRSLEGLFQAQGARPPVTQVNWAVGHTLGAAGALQALAAVLLLERGHVPGVWGADGRDGFYTAFPGAACRARRVLQVTRSLSGKTALLVFERWGQA